MGDLIVTLFRKYLEKHPEFLDDLVEKLVGELVEVLKKKIGV